MPDPLDPNSPEYGHSRAKMQAFGEYLSKSLPGLGWALMVYEFEAPGIGNYISNGTREDMIKALREAADRLEKT